MPAVVRVKRRIDEEPLSAFILNGKRRRIGAEDKDTCTNDIEETEKDNGNTKGEISTVLKFAGTISQQDNTATSQLARSTKDKAKDCVQLKLRKSSNLTERSRIEVRQSSQQNRFHVVNCHRTAVDEVSVDDSNDVTIVDIEKQATSNEPCNATQNVAVMPDLVQPVDSDIGYVYDIYLPENEESGHNVDLMDDNYLSVRAFDDLVYQDAYDNDSDDDDDSEDSNNENHYANDYPEEGGDDSDEASDIQNGVEKLLFDDDSEEEINGYDDSSDDEDYTTFQDPYIDIVKESDDD